MIGRKRAKKSKNTVDASDRGLRHFLVRVDWSEEEINDRLKSFGIGLALKLAKVPLYLLQIKLRFTNNLLLQAASTFCHVSHKKILPIQNPQRQWPFYRF